MKTKTLIILALCTVGIFAYQLRHINPKRIFAEIKIQSWADSLRDTNGTGRYCAAVNYWEVNRLLKSMGKETIEASGVVLIDLPGCWPELELVEMTYYPKYEVVSGVYRCAIDEVVEELQLAMYLNPTAATKGDYCKHGKFRKDWNIPVGETTKFSLP